MKTLEAAQHIHILFEDSIKELLEAFNCTVNMLPDHESEWLDAPVAVIDAGSEDLEIKIALEVPMSVLALSYPVPSIEAVDDESLEDWISEMANQLIGRLKSKMMHHNEEIMLGLPSIAFGMEIDSLIDPGPNRCSNYIEVDREPCAFHIGLEFFSEDVCFVNEDVEVEDMLMESDIELF